MSSHDPQLRQIRASAGSGKTYELTTSFLKHLSGAAEAGGGPFSGCSAVHSGPHGWPEILAVTFTNRAAAEMQERIIGRLKDTALGTGKPAPGWTREQARRWVGIILRRYGALNVRTIDSLLHLIVRLTALELDLPPDFEPVFATDEAIAPLLDSLLEQSRRDERLHSLLEEACRNVFFHSPQRGFLAGETLRGRVMELLLVLAGNVLMSIGVGAFVIPEELMSGGATGLGLLAAHYFHIPVAVFLGGYNAIMFVVGALTLGKHFAVTTLISSFLFPFLLSQIQLVVTEPLTADPMLATVLGGLLIGAGIGLVIRAGSSTGGNDVPVLLLKKKLGIPLSVSMYGFDIVILLFQIPYSQLEKALYSIILIILYSMIADKASTMGKSRMQVRIISKDYQKITDAIKTQINRGVTLYHIAGGYTGEESCEVMTILTSRELNELSDLVTEIDPKAFMTIARVNEARGRGFSIGKMEP